MEIRPYTAKDGASADLTMHVANMPIKLKILDRKKDIFPTIKYSLTLLFTGYLTNVNTWG